MAKKQFDLKKGNVSTKEKEVNTIGRNDVKAVSVEVPRRFMRFSEAARHFSLCQTTLEKYAKISKSVYKLGKVSLVDIDKLQDYILMYGQQ